MSIGYACITVGVPDTALSSCVMKNASPERLKELIEHNLNSLENMISYNAENAIKLFRISSDLIPFGSSPANTLPWQDIFKEKFESIGKKISQNGIRVSMHPGQYTVLNSPDSEVVKKSIEDLRYHFNVLKLLGTKSESKIILHVGGVYGDKVSALARFCENFSCLDDEIKERIAIENDERNYNAEDVLDLAQKLGIPAVFDNLHNSINPSGISDENKLIKLFAQTWKQKDGRQKIHYSEQKPNAKAGSHSDSVSAKKFLDFYRKINGSSLDIMLEVKDKNLSAVKCLNLLSEEKNIKALENEWSKYKYKVLEMSPTCYGSIRELLKNKTAYPAEDFYSLIEEALISPLFKQNIENAALHIWGYFKKYASQAERKGFFTRLENYLDGKASLLAVKNFLLKLAQKYDEKYLLHSYYFWI
jgi:UV DNA damage endonuclease